jgi:hypothetical protein
VGAIRLAPTARRGPFYRERGDGYAFLLAFRLARRFVGFWVIARCSAGVGRRPIVIQTPSGSRTLAIHPSVVAGEYRVGRAPDFSKRRWTDSSVDRGTAPTEKSMWSISLPTL